MLSIISTLIGSKVGRIALVVAITVATIFLILWQAYRKGAQGEQAKQLQRKVRSLQNMVVANDEVRRMDRASRRAYVEQWLRKP